MLLIKLGLALLGFYLVLEKITPFLLNSRGTILSAFTYEVSFLHYAFLGFSFVFIVIGILFIPKIVWYLKVLLLPVAVALYLGIWMLPYKVTYSTMDYDGAVIQKAKMPYYPELALIVGILVLLGSVFWIWKGEKNKSVSLKLEDTRIIEK